MPEFHAKMKDKLRTVEQGADTIIWLACSKPPLQNENGLFYQDRQPVSTHLPLTNVNTDVKLIKNAFSGLMEAVKTGAAVNSKSLKNYVALFVFN